MAEKKVGFFAYWFRGISRDIEEVGKKTGLSKKINDLLLSPGDEGFAEKFGEEAEREILEAQANKPSKRKDRKLAQSIIDKLQDSTDSKVLVDADLDLKKAIEKKKYRVAEQVVEHIFEQVDAMEFEPDGPQLKIAEDAIELIMDDPDQAILAASLIVEHPEPPVDFAVRLVHKAEGDIEVADILLEGYGLYADGMEPNPNAGKVISELQSIFVAAPPTTEIGRAIHKMRDVYNEKVSDTADRLPYAFTEGEIKAIVQQATDKGVDGIDLAFIEEASKGWNGPNGKTDFIENMPARLDALLEEQVRNAADRPEREIDYQQLHEEYQNLRDRTQAQLNDHYDAYSPYLKDPANDDITINPALLEKLRPGDDPNSIADSIAEINAHAQLRANFENTQLSDINDTIAEEKRISAELTKLERRYGFEPPELADASRRQHIAENLADYTSQDAEILTQLNEAMAKRVADITESVQKEAISKRDTYAQQADIHFMLGGVPLSECAEDWAERLHETVDKVLADKSYEGKDKAKIFEEMKTSGETLQTMIRNDIETLEKFAALPEIDAFQSSPLPSALIGTQIAHLKEIEGYYGDILKTLDVVLEERAEELGITKHDPEMLARYEKAVANADRIQAIAELDGAARYDAIVEFAQEQGLDVKAIADKFQAENAGVAPTPIQLRELTFKEIAELGIFEEVNINEDGKVLFGEEFLAGSIAELDYHTNIQGIQASVRDIALEIDDVCSSLDQNIATMVLVANSKEEAMKEVEKIIDSTAELKAIPEATERLTEASKQMAEIYAQRQLAYENSYYELATKLGEVSTFEENFGDLSERREAAVKAMQASIIESLEKTQYPELVSTLEKANDEILQAREELVKIWEDDNKSLEEKLAALKTAEETIDKLDVSAAAKRVQAIVDLSAISASNQEFRALDIEYKEFETNKLEGLLFAQQRIFDVEKAIEKAAELAQQTEAMREKIAEFKEKVCDPATTKEKMESLTEQQIEEYINKHFDGKMPTPEAFAERYAQDHEEVNKQIREAIDQYEKDMPDTDIRKHLESIYNEHLDVQKEGMAKAQTHFGVLTDRENTRLAEEKAAAERAAAEEAQRVATEKEMQMQQKVSEFKKVYDPDAYRAQLNSIRGTDAPEYIASEFDYKPTREEVAKRLAKTHAEKRVEIQEAIAEYEQAHPGIAARLQPLADTYEQLQKAEAQLNLQHLDELAEKAKVTLNTQLADASKKLTENHLVDGHSIDLANGYSVPAGELALRDMHDILEGNAPDKVAEIEKLKGAPLKGTTNIVALRKQLDELPISIKGNEHLETLAKQIDNLEKCQAAIERQTQAALTAAAKDVKEMQNLQNVLEIQTTHLESITEETVLSSVASFKAKHFPDTKPTPEEFMAKIESEFAATDKHIAETIEKKDFSKYPSFEKEIKEAHAKFQDAQSNAKEEMLGCVRKMFGLEEPKIAETIEPIVLEVTPIQQVVEGELLKGDIDMSEETQKNEADVKAMFAQDPVTETVPVMKAEVVSPDEVANMFAPVKAAATPAEEITAQLDKLIAEENAVMAQNMARSNTPAGAAKKIAAMQESINALAALEEQKELQKKIYKLAEEMDITGGRYYEYTDENSRIFNQSQENIRSKAASDYEKQEQRFDAQIQELEAELKAKWDEHEGTMPTQFAAERKEKQDAFDAKRVAVQAKFEAEYGVAVEKDGEITYKGGSKTAEYEAALKAEEVKYQGEDGKGGKLADAETKLEQELARIEKELEGKLAQIEVEFDSQMEGTSKIADLKERSAKRKQLVEEQEQKTVNAEKAAEDARNAAQEAATQAKETAKTEYETATAKITTDYRTEMAEKHGEYAEGRANELTTHTNEMAALEEKHNGIIKENREQLEGQIADTKNERQETLDAINDKRDKGIETLTARYEEIVKGDREAFDRYAKEASITMDGLVAQQSDEVNAMTPTTQYSQNVRDVLKRGKELRAAEEGGLPPAAAPEFRKFTPPTQ